MEVEIDPLSMLEQTMQVNDYSVTSNGDQDIVCLSDGSEEPPLEINLTEVAYSQEVNSPKPLVLGTMPNGAVILDPARNELAYVLDPMQTLQEESCDNLHDDETMGFGEHFLVNPGPSTSAGPSTQSCPSPPSHSPSERIGRTRGGRGSRSNRGSRGKRGANNSLANGHHQSYDRSQFKKSSDLDLLSSAIIGNNFKRLSFVSSEEQSYRLKIYNEFQKVLKSRLDCTICGTHIGCSIELNVFYITHPLLKVLTCSSCREKYCKTDWTLGPENKDSRCRWCASSGKNIALKNCSNCPFAFCESCITRNYSKRDCNRVMNNLQWLCYVCQMVPLYYLRATTWALQNFIMSLSKRRYTDAYKKDMSLCCKVNNTPIDVEDDDDFEIISSTLPTVSCLALSSRVDVLFSGIESIKQAVKAKLGTPVSIDGIDELVSNINLSLAKIGCNVESCLEYIENWRVHTLEQHKKEEANKLEEKRKKEGGRGKASPVRKAKKKVNGSPDYSKLFKKFNIKPCHVLLERINLREETSKPPDFFLSLVPSPAVQEVIEVFEEEDDDDIIWVDDKK